MFRSISITIRRVVQVLKNEVKLLFMRSAKRQYRTFCLGVCITHMMVIDINRNM